MNVDAVLTGVAASAVTAAARETWRAARALRRAVADVSATRRDLRAVARQLGTYERDPAWAPLEPWLHDKARLAPCLHERRPA